MGDNADMQLLKSMQEWATMQMGSYSRVGVGDNADGQLLSTQEQGWATIQMGSYSRVEVGMAA